MRVVETLTEGYQRTHRNVTCDNYFIDLALAQTLLSQGLTLVGTLRKNKRFIPAEFLPNRNRPEKSNTEVFDFTEKATLMSSVPKRSRAVILLSTMHHNAHVVEDKKPEIIIHYNATEGGVDSLD